MTMSLKGAAAAARAVCWWDRLGRRNQLSAVRKPTCQDAALQSQKRFLFQKTPVLIPKESMPGCRATIPKEIFILEDASSDPKRIDARMPRYNPKRIFYFRQTPVLIPKDSRKPLYSVSIANELQHIPYSRSPARMPHYNPKQFFFQKDASSDPKRLKKAL